MKISTTVELGPNDSFAYTPDAAAAQVLAALGGNPTKDHSSVTITQDATGTAGASTPAATEAAA